MQSELYLIPTRLSLLKINIDTRGSLDIVITIVVCIFVIISSQFGNLYYAHSAIGWSVALFFLGYSIISIAFPIGQKYLVTGFSTADNVSGLSLAERLIGSFFLSLAFTSISPFLFNSLIIPTGLGFFVDISTICLISSIAALYRRLNLDQDDRFTVEYEIETRNWKELTSGEKRTYTTVVIFLIVVSGVSINEFSQEKLEKLGFTEMYFSDQSGDAVFPDQVNTFDNSEIFIEIYNYEGTNREFKVQIEHLYFSSNSNFNISSNSTPIDSYLAYEIEFLSLDGGNKVISHDFSFTESGLWCIQASLTMLESEEIGENPYRQLRLFIRVN